ncbi:TPA: aldo/keto reductase [Candidatus Poribacteria bacterium]|nr:aldo/keto reductase [Candidatus Poribacteria bacterium]HEX30437.1 aldo/keto reductase [Candidatus Poribacteria bacterium]
MQYREYGNTGIKLSALGFGCMRFPTDENRRIKEDESIEMLKYAYEHGVNIFDSAAVYNGGDSERVLGKAVKEMDRSRIYISTKNHYKGPDAGEWRRTLEGSLERLDIDYIDFYHMHDLRLNQFIEGIIVKGGPLQEALKAKEEGLIRHLCFSSHDDPENVKKMINTGYFEGILVQYNILDRAYEDVIAHARQKGLGVLVMGPVGGGRLAAPSEQIQKLIPGGAKTSAEAALRIVLANEHVTTALSGMSSMQMVVENIETASRTEPLSEDEKRHMAEMLEQVRKLAELYCTGCGYCMPCPNGVDIPANFRAMIYYKVYGLKDYAKSEYRRLKNRKVNGEPKPASADVCVECGQCEAKCPQNIPIIKQLKEVAEVLGA